MDATHILGVKIHRVTMDEALREIEGFVASGKGHLVVTVDASSVVIAQRDAEFREIVNGADLVTPDSAGILLAAKWFGCPLPERVSGVDLALRISERAAAAGWPMFLLGGAPGVAALAGQELRKRFAGLKIAGTHHGYFEDDEEIVREIRESGAKVLFVALGIPKQEKWIQAHLKRLGVCAAIGVGGSLDVFSGKVPRAPEWMRRHGLEWIHRLLVNPRKIRKVALLPRFLLMVAAEKVTRRRSR